MIGLNASKVKGNLRFNEFNGVGAVQAPLAEGECCLVHADGTDDVQVFGQVNTTILLASFLSLEIGCIHKRICFNDAICVAITGPDDGQVVTEAMQYKF